jgi:hypothetical protein
LHLPFIYYIAKENLMTVIDEIINSSLSDMIDRVRKGVFIAGDYRFFLVKIEKVNKDGDKNY